MVDFPGLRIKNELSLRPWRRQRLVSDGNELDDSVPLVAPGRPNRDPEKHISINGFPGFSKFSKFSMFPGSAGFPGFLNCLCIDL